MPTDEYKNHLLSDEKCNDNCGGNHVDVDNDKCEYDNAVRYYQNNFTFFLL